MKIDHPALSQIPQLRALWQEAFGDDDAFLDLFFSAAFSPRRCLCVSNGSNVVAAAYWFDCKPYAYVYAVATARSHRGMGLCHQLMAQIHSLLEQQGYAGVVLVPGDESLRRFYTGMGYESFGGIREFEAVAGQPIATKRLSSQDYASMRRQFLPEGAVLQEGESLAFLSDLAEFYSGEGWLLAAARNGETLRGLELLGNTDAAPGILAALGANRGTFRTPGATPFAMCKSLLGKNIPSYLGFAFD